MKLTKREAKRSGKGLNSENTAVHRNVSEGENRKKIITAIEKEKSDWYGFDTFTSAISVQRFNKLSAVFFQAYFSQLQKLPL